MEIFSRLSESYASLVGAGNRKTPQDREFEGEVLSDPSKSHVDITSNDVHRRAIEYNKGMNTQAMIRSEISYYLQWAALGLFGALLGAGATGQFAALTTALTSLSGIGIMAGAVALAGAAIYVKVNNAKIQSEKNMNLGEFEMRRSAKIMAKELAQEMHGNHATPPEINGQEASPETRRWVEYVHESKDSPEISSQRVH